MTSRLVLVALLVLSCGGERAPAPSPSTAAAPRAEAEMCAEHGVLEALCTQCHPRLVAVFQGNGDWCPEHGFPESICPICHPERGGRPAVDVTTDEAPRDGIPIVLARPEAAAVVGITTAALVPAPATRTLTVNAVIGPDATRRARVSPRVDGVVATLAVDVGMHVDAGALLATIESATTAEIEARLGAARANLAGAKKLLARLTSVLDATSERARDEARMRVRDAEADVAALEAQQRQLGPSIDGRAPVRAPLAGTVVVVNKAIGEQAARDDVLFEIVDTSVVWAALEIPERDVALVDVGMQVVVAGRGAPINTLAPTIDPQSRTVAARVALPNADGQLRTNQLVQATLAVAGPTDMWLVPRAAVQRAKSVDLVFVKLADDRFEGRRVVLGPTFGDRVAVRGRLAATDVVVVDGAFILKTETLRDSIGAGCCADEGTP